MKFLIDQDVYQVTVDFLQNLGHDVITAKDVGLSSASDEDLLRYAYRNGLIFITRDKGFSSLVFLFRQECNGVILLRIYPATIEVIHHEFARFLHKYADSDLWNHFVVIEPKRHRIRTLK